jgi:catalase
VQLFVNEEKTPVNDASIAWKAPLVTAGEVEIATTPTEEDEQVINSMAFNPANGFEPLGITHARKEVYMASARNRQAKSSDEVRREFAKRR